MTKAQKEKYESTEELREILQRALNGKKFRLDCGHHVTWCHHLGSDITIYNGKKLTIICSLCGY